MNELVFCKRPTDASTMHNLYGMDSELLHGRGGSNPGALSAFTPYVFGQDVSASSQYLLDRLSNPQTNRELTHLALSYGADNTLALSDITSKLLEYNIGVVGASTSVYANRLGGFAGAVQEYQDALLEYADAKGASKPVKEIARQKAQAAFDKLQTRFRHELKAVNAANKSRKGTPLSSIKRATNIANSSRDITKLEVTSQAQAHNLLKFTKHAKVLGNGLAVIDFTSRVGNIHNEYKAGGNWERELFIESSSFAASAAAGTLVVNAGSAALGMLMVATPVGWVGLIVGGIAVAGAAAATSMAVNSEIKTNGGGWYDSLMGVLGVR
ncbi:hypothetical protein [Halioxenophilus aromaticivorans]|uniref:Channel forming colicins domain-containing protein n=1 Tax=Halioxenophilus aromaticivorans TaxID=1306992 RepID=A0AAV3U5V2_9ALTE